MTCSSSSRSYSSKRPEIAQQDIARQVGILEAGEVGEGLRFGFSEVAPRAFLLHEQYALPEEVDEAALVAQQFYGFPRNVATRRTDMPNTSKKSR